MHILKESEPELQAALDAILKDHPKLHKNALHGLRLVFRHPVSHDLKWTDINSVLKDAGATYTVSAHHREHVELNGVTRVFNTTKANLETKDVLNVRHFLLQALLPDQPADPLHTKPTATVITKPDGTSEKSALLVMDNEKATFYRLWVVPLDKREPDPEGAVTEIKHLVTAEDYGHSHGKKDIEHGHSRHPHTSDTEYHDYFNRVAVLLADVDKLLLVGHGGGHSFIAEIFAKYLNKNKPMLGHKIIGLHAVKQDTSHMTRPQLLHFARSHIQSFDDE